MWRLVSERTGAKGPVSRKPQELPRGWGWTRGEVGGQPASRQGRGQRGSLPPSSDSNEVPLETWSPREPVPVRSHGELWGHELPQGLIHFHSAGQFGEHLLFATHTLGPGSAVRHSPALRTLQSGGGHGLEWAIAGHSDKCCEGRPGLWGHRGGTKPTVWGTGWTPGPFDDSEMEAWSEPDSRPRAREGR